MKIYLVSVNSGTFTVLKVYSKLLDAMVGFDKLVAESPAIEFRLLIEVSV